MSLYKYVTSDRIDILKNGAIRFTQPGALNDPWEMRPYIERIFSENTFENEIAKKARVLPHNQLAELTADELWKKMPRRQRRATSKAQVKNTVANLIRLNPNAFEELYKQHLGEALEVFKLGEPDFIETIPEILNKAVGVLSLSEVSDHPLMWSHYAGNHSGFVISFDESHSFFTARKSENDTLSGLHKITYASERPSLSSLEELEKSWVPLFFTKSEDWKYEKEWRMVRALKEATKVIENPAGNIYLFDSPPTSITGIIFGCQMSNECRAEIMDFIKGDERYKHLTFAAVVQDKKTFAFKIDVL